MRPFLAALLTLPMLAGCAGQPPLEARLGALVGLSEDDLVRRVGEPTRAYDANGTRFVAYYQYWPDFVYGFRPIDAQWTGTPQLIDRFCETTFAMEQGRVASFALRGSTCGWGGYPYIAPA